MGLSHTNINPKQLLAFLSATTVICSHQTRRHPFLTSSCTTILHPRFGGLDGKESTCSVGDPGSVPGSGRSSGEGNGCPTPVFLPGESHRQRNLVGYSPWGHRESDMTKRLTLLDMENFSAARQSGQNPSKPLPSVMVVFSLSSHWEGRPAPPTVVRNQPGMEMPAQGSTPGCQSALSV